jgi:hypothetical protein
MLKTLNGATFTIRFPDHTFYGKIVDYGGFSMEGNCYELVFDWPGFQGGIRKPRNCCGRKTSINPAGQCVALASSGGNCSSGFESQRQGTLVARTKTVSEDSLGDVYFASPVPTDRSRCSVLPQFTIIGQESGLTETLTNTLHLSVKRVHAAKRARGAAKRRGLGARFTVLNYLI